MVLDGVSAFPRVLSPLVSPCLPFYPMVCPPSHWDKLFPLVSPCLPSCSPSGVLLGVLTALLRWSPWCWMVRPPFPRSSLPLSPIVPLLVSFCWLVCPPFRHLVSTCPIVPLLVSLCWMVCPPSRGSCPPLSPLAHCTPVLDGASAFRRILSPLVSAVYPFLFPFVG